MTKTIEEQDHAKDQARSQYESVESMVARLKHAQECDGEECELSGQEIKEGLGYCASPEDEATQDEREEYHDEDKAREMIENDPLSVQVRAGQWQNPGAEPERPDEYMILLCTGGPAVRITGELGLHGEPTTARIESQDWFIPWEAYYREEHEGVLLEYARVFWFGE